MKRIVFTAAAVVAALACAVLYAADIPVFGEFRFSNTGPVVSFVAGTGTNSVLNVPYDGELPFKLGEVTATVDSVAVDTAKVSRVWSYARRTTTPVVTTNFFGQVETNSYDTGFVAVAQTNKVYDSSATPAFGQGWFLPGDVMQIDLDGTTGAVVRIIGVIQ